MPDAKEILNGFFGEISEDLSFLSDALNEKLEKINDKLGGGDNEDFLRKLFGDSPKSAGAATCILLALDDEILTTEQIKEYLGSRMQEDTTHLSTYHERIMINPTYLRKFYENGLWYNPFSKDNFSSAWENFYYTNFNPALQAIKFTEPEHSTNSIWTVADVYPDQYVSDEHYVLREDARTYLAAWRAYSWDRVTKRLHATIDEIKCRGSEPCAESESKNENSRIIEQICCDLQSEGERPNLQQILKESLKNSSNKFVELVLAYIIMDELKQSISAELMEEAESIIPDIRKTGETERSVELQRFELYVSGFRTDRDGEKAFSKPMGWMCVADSSYDGPKDGPKLNMVPAKLPNPTEKNKALSYFRTGSTTSGELAGLQHSDPQSEFIGAREGWKTTTNNITFSELERSVKDLAKARFLSGGVRTKKSDQAEETMKDAIKRLGRQLVNFTSEKYSTVGKDMGFLGLSGMVVETANLFFSPRNKINLREMVELADRPYIASLKQNAATMGWWVVGAASLVRDSIIKSIQPREITLEPNPHKALSTESTQKQPAVASQPSM